MATDCNQEFLISRPVRTKDPQASPLEASAQTPSEGSQAHTSCQPQGGTCIR